MTNPEEYPMQITLVQTEIEDAIRQYVTRQITINDDQQIDIDLKATRGADGYQAMIDIRAKGSKRQTAAKPSVAASAPVTAQKTEDTPEKVPASTGTATGVNVQVKRRGRPPKSAVAAAAQAAPTPEATPVEEAPAAAEVAQPETEQAHIPNAETVAALEAADRGETEEVTLDELVETDQTVADIAAETQPEAEPETAPAPRKSLFASVTAPTNN